MNTKTRRSLLPQMYLRDMRMDEEEMAASSEFLRTSLIEHKSEGQLLAVKARWAALAIIALTLPLLNFDWEMIYYLAVLGCLALLGWLQLRVGRIGRSGQELFLIFLDLIILTCAFVLPNPLSDLIWPSAMQYHFNNFDYFFIFLAAATLSYSWRTLIAFGTWLAGIWMSAAVLMLFLGYKQPELTGAIMQAVNWEGRYEEFLDPNNVRLSARFQEVLIFGICACILALNGWRTNRLLISLAHVARERTNLARHFPPSIVDQMAQQDEPLGPVRSQKVAVMFADIVGFTRFAEKETPEASMEMLRHLHNLMENAVFTNRGTLDKFLGDGIMATFGTPETTPEDPTNALACARTILTEVEHWNHERAVAGKEPVHVSIGLHFGNVVLGDIGSERLLEFAVIGDAVNVASRLETLTRDLDVRLILSDATLEAITTEKREELTLGLTRHSAQKLKGRDDPVDIWVLS